MDKDLKTENDKLKSQLEEIKKYCATHLSYMWASSITGIINECSFREVRSEQDKG